MTVSSTAIKVLQEADFVVCTLPHTPETVGTFGAGPPQHGLYPDTMARITSDCDAMRSPSIKRPESPRIVMRCAARASNGPNHLGL